MKKWSLYKLAQVQDGSTDPDEGLRWRAERGGWRVQQVGSRFPMVPTCPAGICSWDRGEVQPLLALGNINHAITGRLQMLLTCGFPREMEIAHESSARSRAKAHPILRDRAWQEAPERTFICKRGLLISPSTRSSSSLWQLRLSST